MKKILSLFFTFFALVINGQNIAVSFEEGFIGTRGNNSQNANNVLNFSTLGVSYAQFYQSDDDGDGLFTAQGNDIPGRLKIVLDDGSSIDYAAAVTWRDSNSNNVFGVLFSPSDDPAEFINVIQYNSGAGFLQLLSGNIKNQSSNVGLIVSGSGYTIADGTDEGGNAATKQLVTALNNYYTSSVSSDTESPTISDQEFDYNEGQSANSNLDINVLANDNVGVSSYSITAGDDSSYYQINDNGDITLTETGESSEANDYETGSNQFILTVEVTDAASNSSTATIILNVVNDPTDDTSSATEISIWDSGSGGAVPGGEASGDAACNEINVGSSHTVYLTKGGASTGASSSPEAGDTITTDSDGTSAVSDGYYGWYDSVADTSYYVLISGATGMVDSVTECSSDGGSSATEITIWDSGSGGAVPGGEASG
ncbi:MAG: cadherin repeat domain-containing protein, partial [Candidatus Neomarinimicrobiota bacterium]